MSVKSPLLPAQGAALNGENAAFKVKVFQL